MSVQQPLTFCYFYLLIDSGALLLSSVTESMPDSVEQKRLNAAEIYLAKIMETPLQLIK